MQIGIVGLGRMGAGMARRLAQAAISVLCYDQANEARAALEGAPNIDCAESLAALCARLQGERIIILMLPAGSAVEDTIRDLMPLLSSGDTIVDGGNSYYRDSMRRALALSQHGVRYIDAGVSGGIHGRDQGYCLMLGGTPTSIEIFAPIAKALAPHAENGWLHCGPNGAGHFTKMVHNGIEYGLMAAYAEGLNVLKKANIGKQSQEHDAETTPLRDPKYYQYDIDVPEVTELWRRGSVVASWLLDLTAHALMVDPE